MTTTQSFKIYEVLQKHFKNDADAKTIVAEIEQIVENKISKEKEIIATKEDISRLEVKLETRFNQLIMWMVGTGIGIVGLIKLFIK